MGTLVFSHVPYDSVGQRLHCIEGIIITRPCQPRQLHWNSNSRSIHYVAIRKTCGQRKFIRRKCYATSLRANSSIFLEDLCLAVALTLTLLRRHIFALQGDHVFSLSWLTKDYSALRCGSEVFI